MYYAIQKLFSWSPLQKNAKALDQHRLYVIAYFCLSLTKTISFTFPFMLSEEYWVLIIKKYRQMFWLPFCLKWNKMIKNQSFDSCLSMIGEIFANNEMPKLHSGTMQGKYFIVSFINYFTLVSETIYRLQANWTNHDQGWVLFSVAGSVSYFFWLFSSFCVLTELPNDSYRLKERCKTNLAVSDQAI